MTDLGRAAQLAMRYLDDDLSAAEHAELRDLLAASTDARAVFVATTMTGELVHESLNDRDSDAAPRTPTRPAPADFTHGLRIARVAWSIAATLLLTAVAVAIYVFVIDPQAEFRDPKSAAPIATLIEATSPVTVDDDLAYEGGEYAAGRYRIESGSAQFLLANRVTVNLRGTTRMSVFSPAHAALEAGSAEFAVPSGAEGFTVDLPRGGRVVDLGTRFRVNVDPDGVSRVVVYEGAVDAYPQAAALGVPKRLTRGQVATIDADGIHPIASATVLFVGAQMNTGGRLRSSAMDKPLDADRGGDFVSDGYAFWAVTPVDQLGRDAGRYGLVPAEHRYFALPAYIASVTEAPNATAAADYDYAVIDDPASTPGSTPARIESGLLASPRNLAPDADFVIATIAFGESVPPGVVRIGIVVDAEPIAELTPSLIAVVSTTSGVGDEVAIESESVNGDCDVYLFDVAGAGPGDRIEVRLTRRGQLRPATIVGLTFDTAAVESDSTVTHGNETE